MSLRQKVRDLQHQLRVEAKKSLGQNFLISEHVVSQIVSEVKSFQPQSLIEIGPGLGSLTESLRAEVIGPSACSFTLIELDRVFADHWRNQGVNLLEGDALQLDWTPFLDQPRPLVLVSNLPYQISSRIVIDRCLDSRRVDAMVLMFQKEVAQRLQARQGTDAYGFLTVMAQTFWSTSTVCEAGPGDFEPPPQVASRVVAFKSRDIQIQALRYLQFLKAAFSHPRKIMAANLAALGPTARSQAEEWMQEKQRSLKCRAEELSAADFLSLAQKLGYL